MAKGNTAYKIEQKWQKTGRTNWSKNLGKTWQQWRQGIRGGGCVCILIQARIRNCVCVSDRMMKYVLLRWAPPLNDRSKLKGQCTDVKSGCVTSVGPSLKPGLGIRSFQKNVPFFPFFSILFKRTFRSFRSFNPNQLCLKYSLKGPAMCF